MPSPRQRYLKDVQQEGFLADQSQESAVAAFETLYLDLQLNRRKDSASYGKKLVRRLFMAPMAPIKGLYLWGGVGRGKTYLMDNFYESLPFDNKMRIHFHRFMRRVHHDLTTFRGEKNPLRQVARKIADETLSLIHISEPTRPY